MMTSRHTLIKLAPYPHVPPVVTYIYVMYHYDTNIIHAIAIKSYYTEHITAAWQKILDTLCDHGEVPDIHILENEYSVDLIHIFKGARLKHQLVPLPPHIHTHTPPPV